MKAQYENHYLSDNDIANYARQSFSKLAENYTPEQNSSLIKFLARGMQSGDWEKLIQELLNLGVQYTRSEGNQEEDKQIEQKAKELATYLRKIPEHWVPFGHPHITLRMQAPVPIRTQCFKHKVGFIESEESRRYINSKPEVFIPDYLRCKPEGSIKQGSGDKHAESDYWLRVYKDTTAQQVLVYEKMIAAGICTEQARMVLPQGCEVNWVWTGSLYAYANFYNQRSDSHAQKEIQDLADEVDKIIAPLYPVAWAALTKGTY